MSKVQRATWDVLIIWIIFALIEETFLQSDNDNHSTIQSGLCNENQLVENRL
jgi:hypothetical protein